MPPVVINPTRERDSTQRAEERRSAAAGGRLRGFDIGAFKAQVAKTGVLKSSLYMVDFQTPYSLQGLYPADAPRDVLMFCDQVVLPGVSLATDRVRRYGYGPVEMYPYAPVFRELPLSFISDGRGECHRFFVNWVNSILGFRNDRGVNGGTDGRFPYEVSYKSDYAVPRLDITVMNESGDRVITHRLTKAFPVIVSDVQMAYAHTNSFMSFQVQLLYTDWHSDSMETARIGESTTPGLSLLQRVVKAGTVAQTLSTLRAPRSVGDALNLVNNLSLVGSAVTDLF